ncbi:carboxymuconolactone decarboxylase family protein [Frankia sp. AgB1.9]|uniref:carboxymuconolactone decarboxylase family protein n=1 Tax=unclassified Frankia TaxID=2632575 RepID=UPI00193191F7|nr:MULTISPECIES: carboxymuconolactone decarboxylase family protein [unclassified Frankia]MBL7491866.1 carboxymuconolactone decarboxylase family protein [Frankia sp. AgW1.1]MBL7551978.1 carboxymuconolactone decarboxylase family protein [Frankia sp. AgB1.9]MBL7623252.1 carboxymuconolactone decarboxylase family protein [Frankia sp. AgB1.8]
MPRIPLITADKSTAEQRDLLEQTQRQLGRVPNLYAALAAGPAALRGYLALRDALSAGALDDRLREQLALLVAHENGCEYCLAAHTLRGRRMGMSDEELARVRQAGPAQAHPRAVLRVARQVIRSGGRLTDDQLTEARENGMTDEELAETVAHVALNILSNYYNHLARPDLDFPPAPAVPDVSARPADAPERSARPQMNGSLNWREGATVALADGYHLTDGTGQSVSRLSDVRVAFEGGFAHVVVPGVDVVQVVSAPAIQVVVLQA